MLHLDPLTMPGDFSSFSLAQSCAKSGKLKKISPAINAAIRLVAVRMLIKKSYPPSVRLPRGRFRIGERRLNRRRREIADEMARAASNLNQAI
jgi:hypothetical protein